jgi:hypothetical protein
LGSAQVGIPGTGPTGTPFVCSANVAVPPQLRQEGLTEAVGDIVLSCTGGNTLLAGSQVPFANITITLGTQVTSRILGGATAAASEALLLIDEPGNTGPTGLPGAGPAQPQTLCATPATGCTAFVGAVAADPTAGQAVNQGAGCTVASPPAACTTRAPNMYQGLVSPNSFQVTFNGVPILPPVTSGLSRVFRITNIRANAAGVPAGLGGVGQLQASISISGSSSVPVTNPILTVGFVQTSLVTSLRNVANTGGGSAAGFNQCANATLSPVNVLRFQEQPNFATAFKTRVAPTAAFGSGQFQAANQNIPGTIYNSESDFIQPSVTGSGFTAGLADFGTRLRAVFTNIPTGMSLFVTTTNVTNAFSGTMTQPANGTSVGPYAVGLISETAPEGSVAPSTGTTCFGTGCPTGPNQNISFYQVPLVNGAGTAVWEVFNTNYSGQDTFDFAVYTSYTGNQTNNTPPAGTGTVQMSYAPIVATGGATASSTLPIPRFVDQSSALSLLTVRLCQTVLLFPYVTNASGLETGIAISNTSTDPQGFAVKQAGTCTLNFYGNATIAPFTTPSILSGDANVNTTDWAFALSTIPGANPGFQGYIIAVCNFQYAHGFAFISDVGTRNLAMGYLALIIVNDNANGALGRSSNLPAAENLEH